MSSPGWFPQPDGRERYFDGENWTDHFRVGQTHFHLHPPPQKSNAWKWILVVLFVVGILCCGGFAACTAGVFSAAEEVSKSVEAEESETGGRNVAMEISEGESFEVRGFNYAEGWSVSEGSFDSVDIEGLKVTNNREKPDSANVDIKFMKGSEILASVGCSSDRLQVGETATLSCLSGDDMPTDYDTITIHDTF